MMMRSTIEGALNRIQPWKSTHEAMVLEDIEAYIVVYILRLNTMNTSSRLWKVPQGSSSRGQIRMQLHYTLVFEDSISITIIRT